MVPPPAPPRRERDALPRWARRCLVAGALLLLLPTTGALVGAHLIRQAGDADLQWRRLARVLPHERPPERVKLLGLALPFGAPRAWLASDRRAGLQALWLETDRGPASVHAALCAGATAGTARVQERELAVARWTSGGRPLAAMGVGLERKLTDALLAAVESAPGTACAAVDLTPACADPERDLLLVVARLQPMPGVVDSGAARRGLGEPIGDDELRRFLAAFEVGPGAPEAADVAALARE